MFFHTYFRASLSSHTDICTGPVGILIDVALNIQISLGRIHVFMILSLQIHKQGIAIFLLGLHECLPSEGLLFSVSRSYTFCVGFIPRYFIVGFFFLPL